MKVNRKSVSKKSSIRELTRSEIRSVAGGPVIKDHT